MKRVLIAWELGGNHGHLTNCLHVARALAQQYDVVFATRDVRGAAHVLDPLGFSYVQAPLAPKPVNGAKPRVNYSDMLLGEGYADFTTLRGLVAAWVTLLTRFNIDIVLADHAPTALIACKIANIHAVNIGNGFAAPPAVSPMPNMRPWENIPKEFLINADARVNKQISRVARHYSSLPGFTLADLFAENTLLTCFPELDHYPSRVNGTYAGAMFSQQQTARVEWQGEAPKRILAYLRPEVPGFVNCMKALRESGAEVVVRIPDLSPKQARQLASRRVRIALGGIEFSHLLRDADVMVSYGSSGAVSESLLQGVPQLILSQFVEQHLLGARINSWGGGLALGENREPQELREGIQRVLEEEVYKDKAATFSARHTGYTPHVAAKKIVAQVETALP